MKFEKLLILIFFIGLICINGVSAGWFGYDNGECDLFSITCPEGYRNAGELTYNESIFIATPGHERPYHAITIHQIGVGYVEGFIDFDDEGIEVVDSVDEENFKAYKTWDEFDSRYRNTTYVYYSDGQFEYQIELAHIGCPYDDAQFKEDVELLKNIAHSIRRK